MAQRNGTTGNDIFVTHTESDYLKGQLVFVLGAMPSQGVWPTINILVNGQVVAANLTITANVVAGNTQVVGVTLPSGPINSVAIQYTNDLVTDVDDRNVYVGRVTLNGTDLAIDQAVYVRNDRPTIPGDSGMNWNGTMTWSGSSISAAMSGARTAESHMFNGGDGADFALYTGRERDYGVRYTQDGAIGVTSRTSGFDDGLWNIENVLFDDKSAYGSATWDSSINATERTIDGGRGLDTLVINGSRSEYIVDATTSGFSITGNGVSQWVTNVERLRFDDGFLALDINDNGGKAYRIYQAAFDRVPDVSGLGFWINSLDLGVSLTQVAAFFMTSQEFNTKYGSPTNAQFLNLLYQNVLDRNPDQAGYDYWLPHLEQGRLTRAEVLMFFSESTENKANVIGAIQDGAFYTLP